MLFTPTVQKLLTRNPDSIKLHNQNRCSSCNNACWSLTKNSTFPNSGTMQDYLKFLMNGAENDGNAKVYYRCYCKILHEYLDFPWLEEGEFPHLISDCDSYKEWEEDDDQPKNPKKQQNKKPDILQKQSIFPDFP